MSKLGDYSDDGNASSTEITVMPKIEVFDYDLSRENMEVRHTEDNVASSSGTSLRSSLMAMGFTPSLVDRAIEENGERDADLLLETLFAYSALQSQKPDSPNTTEDVFHDMKNDSVADRHAREVLDRSESSDSLDILFGDENSASNHANGGAYIHIKEDPDMCDDVDDEKRASLMAMNFSLHEINLAMRRIGENAHINEVVDFIFAARIAESHGISADEPPPGDTERNKVPAEY